jgi:hypothetical protein
MKWQNDPDFVAWLLESQYAMRGPKGKIEPYISDGLVLYCHEAWTAGKNHGVVQDLSNLNTLPKLRRVGAADARNRRGDLTPPELDDENDGPPLL